MATGTSKSFYISGGAWSGYTATVDDSPVNASSGVVVNNARQWEWDISSTGVFYSTGTDHMIYFIPGSASNNGEWWQHGSVPIQGTRSGTTITLGTVAVFDETDAFDGDIPNTSGGGTSTEEVLVENAQMVFYSGITGWRFEQRGYAAGSYQLIGGTVNESWTVSTGSNNLQHHISQIPAGGTYELKSGSTVLATLSTQTTKKKVFCNFW